MSLIHKHVAVLQAWACLDLVLACYGSAGSAGGRAVGKSPLSTVKRKVRAQINQSINQSEDYVRSYFLYFLVNKYWN